MDPSSILRPGTFGRDLFAVRPSFGRGERFQLGITALHVRDDVGSISNLRTNPDANGSTQSVNRLPKDNLALGTDMTLRFLSGRLLLQYENAISLLANDISGGPLSRRQIDSLLVELNEDPLDIDFDPLEAAGPRS